MARHDSGKIIWKFDQTTKELFRSRLIWGGTGVLLAIILIIILETVG